MRLNAPQRQRGCVNVVNIAALIATDAKCASTRWPVSRPYVCTSTSSDRASLPNYRCDFANSVFWRKKEEGGRKKCTEDVKLKHSTALGQFTNCSFSCSLPLGFGALAQTQTHTLQCPNDGHHEKWKNNSRYGRLTATAEKLCALDAAEWTE